MDKLKATAIRGGLLSEPDARALDEQAAFALIYQSGLSTSPIVTEISGRGLGMAIVREKVEKLGGNITIESNPARGTTFRILLPVTLATFKGIVVSVGGQSFVIPTASVERIDRIRRSEIQTVENKETILLEGRPCLSCDSPRCSSCRSAKSASPAEFTEVVVLGLGDKRIAFAVDAILNEQEVLVKSIGKPLVRVRNVAGATVLGSGAPAVILNTADLLHSAVHLVAGRQAVRAGRSGRRRGNRGPEHPRDGRLGHLAHALEEHPRIRRLHGDDGGRWRGRADAFENARL